jgi:hypothetical protein
MTFRGECSGDLAVGHAGVELLHQLHNLRLGLCLGLAPFTLAKLPPDTVTSALELGDRLGVVELCNCAEDLPDQRARLLARRDRSRLPEYRGFPRPTDVSQGQSLTEKGKIPPLPRRRGRYIL